MKHHESGVAGYNVTAFAAYVHALYGSTVSSLRLTDLDLVYTTIAAGVHLQLSELPFAESCDELREGALFKSLFPRWDQPRTLSMYHGSRQPAPANTWIEITHCGEQRRMQGAKTQLELSTFWMYARRGSGVWYNTGRTIAPTSRASTFATSVSWTRMRRLRE